MDTNNPESQPLQATICARLDAAIAQLVEWSLTPRAIYLTDDDYAALAENDTRLHHERSGSTAFCWPLSYSDVPIISEHLIEQVEIPVRRGWTGVRRSAVYAHNGQRVTLNDR